MKKKTAKKMDFTEPGSRVLEEVEMEDELVIKGTLDGTVEESEIGERMQKLEEDTSAKALKKELEESAEYKKKKKR